MPTRLWLRWSLRDLRARWRVVVTTALVIAMGTGVYAGLGRTDDWRIASNDVSFGRLGYHDLRVTLSEGSYVGEGRLRGALGRLPRGATRPTAVQERMIVETQVDASHGGRTVLVPGRLVGMPTAGRAASVDRLWPREGRGLVPADAGRRVAVVESNFARFYNLSPQGRVRVAGLGVVPYAGVASQPEYFVVESPGSWGGEAGFAVLFVPLRLAQAAAGRPGRVNEMVLRLPRGSDARAARRDVAVALRRALPGVGTTITLGTAEDVHRVLYRDAHNDQRFYDVFALLLLLGASFAAFNLISRIVESQRREIGIGMALGVEPRALALRPLLLAIEISVLGVLFGAVIGLLASRALEAAFDSQLPLPYYADLFEPAAFARGAAIGFLVPVAAALWPVWRGVRVTPVEAIRVGFRSARSNGLAPLLKHLRLPGRSLGQLPARNFLRAPRRTLLTVLGLGAVLGVAASLGGMVDSFRHTVDLSARETAGSGPSRVIVGLSGFYPRDAPVVRAVERAPVVGSAEPRLKLAGRLRRGTRTVDVQVDLVNPASRIWRPTVSEGTFRPGSRGILISRKAAEDLRVGPGDTLAVRLPVRRSATTFALVERRVRVAGIHPNPIRFFAYLDAGRAAPLGLAGATNVVDVLPAPGTEPATVKRALFGRPGVAAVEQATADTDAIQSQMDEFIVIIQVVELVALVLALLMAFNSASIAGDERAREHATMAAFGVPVRTMLRINVIESLLGGLLATLVGLGIGLALVGWIVHRLLPDVAPDLAIVVFFASGTIAATAALGVLATGIAPLLTSRRLRRMDVPSTLRVVE